MPYKASLLKLFFSPRDQLIRINKAEKVTRVFSLSFILLVSSIGLYGWMAWLGIGTDILSPGAVNMPREDYEAAKLSFFIGRLLYAFVFSLFLLLFPALVFKTFFRITYPKAVLLQTVVLSIFLLERLIWIPLYLFAGIDWYASPFSLGPILTITTGYPFWIYLGGTITLFLVWMVWFQANYLTAVTETKKRWIWTTIIILHLLYVIGAACIAYYATDILTFFLRGQ